MKTSIIFLHGFPFDGSAWDAQLKYFGSKYDVHAPDQRGHRHTVHAGPGPWMMQHFAEDLRTYMDQNKVGKAVLCGLSMGGYIALHFLAQYPERVKALVLCDTRPDADTNEAKDGRFKLIERLRQEGVMGFAKDHARAMVCDLTAHENPTIENRIQGMILGNTPLNIAMVAGALASRRDSTALLENIRVPTAVFVGDGDKVTPPELNEAMAKKIPGAQFRLLKNAGHLSNLEQPELFNRYLEEFLGTLGD